MPPPTPSATRAARLWEVGGQGALTAAFLGFFGWWWVTAQGSSESRPAGIDRHAVVPAEPRPADESAAVALAKAGGYVPDKPGEEPTRGLRKAK